MGDEITVAGGLIAFDKLTDGQKREIIDVLRMVYGGGYVNQKLSWEQLRELRGKSYRSLKALGIEK
jgi:hypothetical protein